MLDDNARNAELLLAELPDPRFVDGTFLRCLYDENPIGRAYQEGIDDDGQRIAHYALVSQEYRNADGPAPFVFSLNAVTRSGGQRRGYFSAIGSRIWAEAGRDGVIGVIGVCNDKSLTPVVRLGWRHICRMPVLVVPPCPIPFGGFESRVVTGEWLDSDEAEVWFGDLDEAPAQDWTNRWTLEHLRWRLGWPGCGPYAVHRSKTMLAVSVKVPVKGVPVTAVLKMAPRGASPMVRSGWGAVSAACRFHRSPVAVYAGFNRWISVRGWPAPERFKPAPLNLMIFSVSDELDQDRFAFDTYELLDMDGF